MVKVIEFSPNYASLVADLHQKHLQSNLKNKLGLKMLAIYYASFSFPKGGACFLAVEDYKLLGFICGVWDQKEIFLNFIKSNPIRIIIFGIPLIFTNINYLKSIYAKLFNGVFSKKVTINSAFYELRPIVVDPSVRGKGVADLLVNYLAQDAVSSGYKEILLKTEKENTLAQKFYEKYGFLKIKEEVLENRSYLIYRLSID